MGGRLLDFLGQGLAAARPAAAGVPALIPTGSAAVYYAYDTGVFSFFDEDAVAWVELDLAALSAIGFQNLADVDWTTPPTDGQFFVWDNTAGKFVPADIPAEYTDTDADARVAAGIATHEGAANPHPGYLTPTEGDAAYAPIAHVGSGGAEHDDVVAAGASGFMTGADKTKLDGIEAGATNYVDADADARIAAAGIGDLSDVDHSTPPTDGQILVWNSGGGAYVPEDPGVGGGGAAWELVFKPTDNEPPTSNYATLDLRNNHPVLDFDATTQETAIFSGVLPSSYAGGGINIAVYFAATSAVTGTVGWDVAIERMDASSLDLDADSFASAQAITPATVPGTSGQLLVTSVNISNGANMDSLAAGEAFRVRIRRDVANDNAAGDAELLRVVIKEQ